MKAFAKYAGTAVLLVVGLTLALWPFLTPAARRGVAIAGAVALPTQILAFRLLLHSRTKLNAFLAVWVGGTLFRIGIVAAVAAVAVQSGVDGAVAMLLALAGFFFALLLLEPVYFALEPQEGRS